MLSRFEQGVLGNLDLEVRNKFYHNVNKKGGIIESLGARHHFIETLTKHDCGSTLEATTLFD